MNKKLIAMALLACSIPVAANAAWNFSTWAKSAGGTISSRNNDTQTNLNGTLFKQYTTHAAIPATVTADTGYTISNITLNGVSLGAQASPWDSALMISGGQFATTSQSLYATFMAAIIPVTASAGANGVVSPTSVSNIRYGKTITPIVFNFAPKSGYKVASISGAGSFTISPAVASALVNQGVTVTIPAGTTLTSAVNLAGTFSSTLPLVDAITVAPSKTVFTNSAVSLTGSGVNGILSLWSLVSSPVGATAFSSTDPFAPSITKNYTPTKAGDYTFKYCVDTACTQLTVTATASFGVAATSQCLNCHNDNNVGSAANVGGYLSSAHAAKGYLCSKCHVGADLGAHPGTVAANICTSCHGVTAPAPPVTANHSTGDTCFSCHKHNATLNTATKPLAISNVTFGTNAGGFITATFDAKTGATPVTGMTATVTSISFVGLVPGAAGASDEWLAWAASTDALVENSAGNYTLTTNKKTADAPATAPGVQRALIQFNNGVLSQRANVVYDFNKADVTVPVASGKEVVNDNSCKECHGYGVTIHSYGRNDTKACIVCHNPNFAANAYDMVTMAHQIHNGDATNGAAKAVISGNKNWADHGDSWGITNTIDPTLLPVKKFVYPGAMLDCAKCHNTVAQADNWKTKPTMIGCKSCHGTITFDGTAYAGIKSTTAVPVAGVLHTATDNSACITCHAAATTAADHVAPISKNPALRTIQATISGVVVDGAGGVTVNYSVVENGAPKTNLTAASYNLVKLVPAVPSENKPSQWQSYLSTLKSGTDTIAPIQNFAPVLQGRTEANTTVGGKFTNLGGGNYSYKFALINSDSYTAVPPVAGSIFTINKATNTNAAGIYSKTILPYMSYPVAYEPNLTHRVGITISNNLADASFDFVPAGGTAETRNIVAWGSNGKSCNSCHGSSKIHAGTNDLKYCVGCHNANTNDPYSGPADIAVPATTDPAFTGANATTVALERIVHKLHMGRMLPSVIAGGSFMFNTQPGATSHDYSKSQYPGGVPQLTTDATTVVPRASAGRPSDCTKCHDESASGMTEAANWKIAGPACFSCHDTMSASNHNKGAVCTTCHTGQDVIDFHFGK